MRTYRFILALGCVAASLLSGCHSIVQTATTTGTGTNAVRRTEIRVRSLGDAKAIVESLNARNGATQSLGAKGIEQETSATNAAPIIGAVVEAAIRAAVKP